jgi:hypothetical protein
MIDRWDGGIECPPSGAHSKHRLKREAAFLGLISASTGCGRSVNYLLRESRVVTPFLRGERFRLTDNGNVEKIILICLLITFNALVASWGKTNSTL